MNNLILSFIPLLMAVMISCNEDNEKFTFSENEEGVEILENGRPVFFYQRKPKISKGKYVCSNYLHPLYSLDGDTLTEEFPADHPYHRGVYWAWHQHYIGGESIGDGWMMEKIRYDVKDLQTKTDGDVARLDIHTVWRSQEYEDGKPYVDEHTTILVRPAKDTYRIIDFKITLQALIPEVTIGGSDDEKGYGGFCCHIRMPDGLAFTSTTGRVTPEKLQIKAGPWMDFSAPFGKNGEISGLTLLCHKSDPGYPQPWILRQKGSMQNIVFPGRERIPVPVEKPLVLRYRLVVHNGNARGIAIPEIQKDYNSYQY
jgi:hypothetical protein